MKKIVGVITSLISPLFFALPAFAQAPIPVQACPPEGPFHALCGLTANRFGSIVGTVITIGFVIAIIIALVFLVWGGIRWIISGGDKTGVESARNTIIAAIIGLVVVFLAYFIINIVLSIFGLSLTNLAIPTLNIVN